MFFFVYPYLVVHDFKNGADILLYQRHRYICLPTLEYYYKFYTDPKNKKLLSKSLPNPSNFKNTQLQSVYGKVGEQLCDNNKY